MKIKHTNTRRETSQLLTFADLRVGDVFRYHGFSYSKDYYCIKLDPFYIKDDIYCNAVNIENGKRHCITNNALVELYVGEVTLDEKYFDKWIK